MQLLILAYTSFYTWKQNCLAMETCDKHNVNKKTCWTVVKSNLSTHKQVEYLVILIRSTAETLEALKSMQQTVHFYLRAHTHTHIRMSWNCPRGKCAQCSISNLLQFKQLTCSFCRCILRQKEVRRRWNSNSGSWRVGVTAAGDVAASAIISQHLSTSTTLTIPFPHFCSSAVQTPSSTVTLAPAANAI